MKPEVLKLQIKTLRLAYDTGNKETDELGTKLKAVDFPNKTIEDQKKGMGEKDTCTANYIAPHRAVQSTAS